MNEMSGNKADDYWNRSLSTGFSFDDEEDAWRGSSSTDVFNFDDSSMDSVFGSNALENELNVFPVQTIISKKNLDAIIDDITLPILPPCREIKDTIKQMLLKQPYDLHFYRSLNQKLELLDEAVMTMDGDIILNIILYLAKTIKLSILYRILQTRKVAFNHYMSYLTGQLHSEEITNLFLATGSSNMIEVFYMNCVDISNRERLQSKLKHFMMEHIGEINSEKEKSLLHDYQNFLKWQIDKNSKCLSVTEELASLCRNVWDRKASEGDLMEFKKLMKIGDFQYEWIVLNTLASIGLWKKISETFLKTNWLTKKNVIKSVIDSEILLLALFRHNPPRSTVEEFLICITDSEVSLSLAKRMKCHRFVIDSYVNQKDRLGLILYKNQLPAQSEEFFYAESTLHSPNIKWKN